MPQANRRAFFKKAGIAAFMGAAGAAPTLSAAMDDIGPGSKFDFDTPYNRIGTDCSKWDGVMKTYNMSRIVAGMGIADVDFKNAPCITSALMKRVQHENWGYLTTPDSFLKGVIAWNKRRHGIDIPSDKIAITTGVHPGIVAALRAFSPAGSKVLMMTPAYDGFYGDLSYLNLRPEESLLKNVNGRFSIDFDDLEKRISRDTNTLILCNPHNPTGNCWSREDLTRVGELCLRRRVIVLADEIHCDFTTKGEQYIPFSTLENRDIVNNSITFKAASKSFGLAAMKCAWFYSTNRDLFNATRAQNKADLTTLGMIASQAAYAEGEPWLNQLVEYLDGNHDFVQSHFQTKMPSLIKVGAKPQGTYLVWVDVSGLSAKIGAKEMAAQANRKLTPGARPLTAEAMVAQWLATNAGVVLNPGTNYGLGGENHMRMNIGTSRKTLESALNALAEAAKKA